MTIPQDYKYYLPGIGYTGPNNLEKFRSWAGTKGIEVTIEQRRFSVKVTLSFQPNDPWTGPDLQQAAYYWVWEIIEHLKSQKNASRNLQNSL